MEICDPSARAVREGELILEEEGDLLQSRVWMWNLDKSNMPEPSGRIIWWSVGDAGYSSSNLISISETQPHRTVHASVEFSAGTGIIASIFDENGTVLHKIVPFPNEYEERDKKTCSEREVSLLFDEAKIWEVGSDWKHLCDDITRSYGSKFANYKDFIELKPIDESFREFSLLWGGVEFRFDIEDPKGTFRVSGRG